MKTATSSIQAWLKKNSDWLASEGWLYPGWPCRSLKDIQRLADRAGDKNLVISDEGLWHFAGTARSDTPRIAECLSNFDVSILVYFRRPDSFLESWFKQGLKFGTGAHSIPKFLRQRDVLNSVLPRLDYFTHIFGKENLIVAPYETKQLADQNMISDFSKRSGVPCPPKDTDDSRDIIRENQSPGADAILLAGIMRKVFSLDQAAVEQVLSSTPVGGAESRHHSIFTAKERMAIMAHFRPQFREIQTRFGTGGARDFFLDWEDDKSAPEVSALRRAYDSMIRRILPD